MAAAAAVVPLKRLTILLDWFINPDHAPLLLAQQNGAFARAGLAVELIAPADTSMSPKLAAAGQGDIAITDQPHFHEQIAGGLPLLRFGALIDSPLATLVTLRPSGITTLAALRGRRIGHGPGDAERAMVGAMLATAHLTLNDVHMVEIGTQLTVALLGRQVDAVTVYRNFEIPELRAAGADPISFDYETHGVPPYDEMIYVIRPALAQDSRLPRFLRAMTDSAAAIRANPAGTWQTCQAAYPDLRTPLNQQAWLLTAARFARQPAALDRARYTNFARFLAGQGIIPAPPAVDSYTLELRSE